jgi:hypothetical protein
VDPQQVPIPLGLHDTVHPGHADVPARHGPPSWPPPRGRVQVRQLIVTRDVDRGGPTAGARGDRGGQSCSPLVSLFSIHR